MGPPGGVVDPLTGLRIDDDEDDDDAAKGRRAAKAEKPRRRKGKPSDAADAGGGHAGKPDASKPRPRSRQKRCGASSDDDAPSAAPAEPARADPADNVPSKAKGLGKGVNLFDPAATASRFITRRFGFTGGLVFVNPMRCLPMP